MSKSSKYSNLPNIALGQTDIYETSGQPEEQITDKKLLSNLNSSKFGNKNEFNQPIFEQVDSSNNNIDLINIQPKDAFNKFKDKYLTSSCFNESQLTYQKFGVSEIINSSSRSEETLYQSYCRLKTEITELIKKFKCIDDSKATNAFQSDLKLSEILGNLNHLNKQLNSFKIDDKKENTLFELIDYIRKQNSHINQLKNLLNKTDKSSNKIKKGREFDFSKYNKKHIALKFFYLGWNYDGFVVQENTKNTIEDHLFNALLKAHLIENRQNSNYHRCGRTDKGVSAFSQVITLDLRSKLSSTGIEEIKYTKILNKILPKDIRCLCSAEVDSQFSARFNCKSRTYKYYFPIGNLNLESLITAAKYLIGTYDFRNFAKLDKTKLETNYIRSIESVNITKIINGQNNNQDIYELEIKSSSFLWHQIRNIVSVLFTIGNQKEKPELILDLLDLNKFTKKPQYNLANELPLVLFDCEFNINNWEYDNEALKDAQKSLNDFWLDSTIKSVITLKMLNNLNQTNNDYLDFFVKDLNSKNYKQFKYRGTCNTTLNDNLKIKMEKKLKHKLIDKSIEIEKSKKIKLDDN